MSPLTRLDSYQGAEDQWRELLASSAADTLFPHAPVAASLVGAVR